MTRSIRTMLAAAFGLLLVAGTAAAQDAGHVPGIRGEIIANLNEAGDKVIELAGAVPARKWAWRPAKGVRSVGEVYRHVAQGNYLMCSFLGVKLPMSMDELRKLETTPESPDKTIQALKDSYAFAARAIADTPESELATTVQFFGQTMSKEALMFEIASHSHEHLGQSIAYARMNGVVPPWTAREYAAAAKKAAEKKAAGGK